MDTAVKDTHLFINMELGHHLAEKSGGNLLLTLLSKTDQRFDNI